MLLRINNFALFPFEQSLLLRSLRSKERLSQYNNLVHVHLLTKINVVL